MAEEPNTIRDEVEQTRERMGETIDALAYKADVKARARDSVTDKVDTVKERLGMASGKVSELTPDGREVKQQARRAVGIAQENPLGLAVGALAVGFLAGMLLPGSRIEDERIGPVADQVKDQVRQTGQEALEHGKEMAQSAAETVREEAPEHGQQLAERAREGASSVRA
jgi:ElaB/YqjD/DUF883 family membrane-anchored ribosome-binding protein